MEMLAGRRTHVDRALQSPGDAREEKEAMLKPDYEREGVRLYLGDCRDVLPHLEGVDAVVTDPPYGVGFKYESHDDSRDGYEEWCQHWFSMLLDLTGNILISPGNVNVAMWARVKPFKWIAAWLKPAAMGRSPFGFCNWEPMLLWGSPRQSSVDVFTAPIIPDSSIDGHPCPKPLKWGIESISRMGEEGCTILDPFMGSGTTGVACIRTGRKFIGIEKEPKYFDIAVARINAEFDRAPLFAAETAEVQSELFGANE